MSQQPLYVEFVGLPGAGKTTVFESVIPQLTALRYRVVGKYKVYTSSGLARLRAAWWQPGTGGQLLAHCTNHLAAPRLTAATYRYLVSTGGTNGYRMRMARSLIRGALCSAEQCEVVRRGQGDLVIRHQGFVAYLRELTPTDSVVSDPNLSRLAQSIVRTISPARVILVLFDVDASAAASRLRARGLQWGPYDRMSYEHAISRLAKQIPRMELAVRVLSHQRESIELLRIDATQPPQSIAEHLASVLVARLTDPMMVNASNQ